MQEAQSGVSQSSQRYKCARQREASHAGQVTWDGKAHSEQGAGGEIG